ncbi:MAG: D-alanine--D-alanine ligase [Lawsonibacter sp.]|nr:D-alanine--D-alanine ligase [Lawsonibacter sp.]
MNPKTILVLFGGCSSEHDVSLQSACGVLSHWDHARYTPLTVGITREGAWLHYAGTPDALPGGGWQKGPCVPCTLRLDRGRAALLELEGPRRELPFDGAFPLLHGKNGEDGTLQGLLELAGVPIVGCGALSSALCMDKDRAHRLAALAGVAVPESVLLPAGAGPAEFLRAARTLAFPLFVKPVRSGSSLGVSRVTEEGRLLPAVEEALRHDREVLLEQAVPGFEVGCAVMGCETLTMGEVDEIQLSQGFFDFTEKYTLNTSAIHCPARVPPRKAEEIKQAARTVYRALDCRVMARVDLFLTPEGGIVFNEVNTVPGFTPHSRYPAMMARAGLDFPSLVSRLIELGVEA